MSRPRPATRTSVAAVAAALALCVAPLGTSAASAGTASQTRAVASLSALPAGPVGVPALGAVIDPGDYVCTESIRRQYDVKVTKDLDPDVLNQLAELDAFAIPNLYAERFLGTRGGGFGVGGSRTREVKRTLKDLVRFWDVKPEDVRIVPQKGKAAFDDTEGVATIFREQFGLSADAAVARAKRIQELLAKDPGLRGGDNPALTMGAYTRIPGMLGWTGPYTIFLGDGFVSLADDEGLPDAVRQVVAHEYAHVVQDLIGRTTPLERTPEQNRAGELSTDAMGAYYVAHQRGGKVLRAGDAAVQLLIKSGGVNGECDFEWVNHHGTVAQREKAAAWGIAQANPAKRSSRILGAREFMARFDAYLPTLVAPDAR